MGYGPGRSLGPEVAGARHHYPPQPANAGVCLTGSWTPGTPQAQTRVSVMAVRYSSTGVRHSGCERAAGPQRHPLEDDVTHCLGYLV